MLDRDNENMRLGECSFDNDSVDMLYGSVNRLNGSVNSLHGSLNRLYGSVNELKKLFGSVHRQFGINRIRSYQTIMFYSNITRLSDLTFILLGIPGLERFHLTFSALMFCMFICTLTGNCIITLIIMYDQSLHAPMYFLIGMLAFTDLFLSLTVTPKMMGVFWFHAQEIYFSACVMQMFLVQLLTVMESGILTAMAMDRYIAICQPLRYTSILTGQRIAGIGIIVVMRGVVAVSPCIYLVARLPFCRNKGIRQPYCDHMAIARLACADTTINSIYGLVFIVLICSIDISCICFSYIWILKAVQNLSTKLNQNKALSTCTSHLCVMSFFYIPGIFSLLAKRLGNNIPDSMDSILSTLYILMPPTLNPIVYGVRTKQFRENVKKIVWRK
ncbi:olfactory receptor 52J3-like [Bombina bombina]|uniref:olfactory receptor 52J3-like n=1 Tax=Bombina bombina TaxID=8345 RepID=UPI00235B180A|nr:olfactory receptor 52J3-like [Bombina bombina]